MPNELGSPISVGLPISLKTSRPSCYKVKIFSRRRRCFSASSAFYKPTPAHRTSLSTHTVVGRFRSPVRQSETRCLTSSEIRRVVLTVLYSFLRQSSLVSTNVTSALEVALYKSTFYLLTYLLMAALTLKCDPDLFKVNSEV